MNTLFLAWQEEERTRRWFVIGRLDRTERGFRFQYVNQDWPQIASEYGFESLLDFPDVGRVYESTRLFPMFENRLLSRSRPDYGDFLKRLAIDDKDHDPLDILARSEGIRATDSFEVFPKPEPDEQGHYRVVFLARGVRHLPRHVEDVIAKLTPGDKLDAKFGRENEQDCNALLVRSDGMQVGWIPRYLCPDIKRLKGEYPSSLELRVEQVNLSPAPVQQRLLCSITAPWPQWEPFSDKEFAGLVEQAA